MAFDPLQQFKLRRVAFGQEADPDPFGTNLRNRATLPQAPTVAAPPMMNQPAEIQTPFMNQYREYLANQPERRDYQLSGIGKALALGAGVLEGSQRGIASGINVGTGLLNEPYRRALEAHEMKGGRLGKLAELEQYTIGQEEKKRLQMEEQALKTQKHELDIRKTELDERKQDAIEAVQNAQIGNYNSLIADRNMKIMEDKTNGHQYLVDLRTNQRVDLGKFAESLGETGEREFGFFKKKYGVEQAGREALQRGAQANALELAKIRLGNEESLEQLKSNLRREDKKWETTLEAMGNVSPLDQKRMFDLAVEQTKHDLRIDPEKLAEESPMTGKGKEELEAKYKAFYDGVRERLNRIRTRAGHKPDVEGKIEIPPVTAPGTNPLRDAAINEIRRRYPDDPSLLNNEDAIKDTIKWLQEQGGSKEQSSNIPAINLPPAANLANPLVNPNFGQVNPQLYSELNRIPAAAGRTGDWLNRTFLASDVRKSRGFTR